MLDIFPSVRPTLRLPTEPGKTRTGRSVDTVGVLRDPCVPRNLRSNLYPGHGILVPTLSSSVAGTTDVHVSRPRNRRGRHFTSTTRDRTSDDFSQALHTNKTKHKTRKLDF